ncbi:hypothetical protein [Pseudomonas viridiflava]|uniref:hypothetical protein n=1 Tax=Pseudomonas viridiflava TaxID=33069 RepID=UPI001F1524C5|nr:hypothetical protein [Pseudomonas viridiflava]
MGRRLIEQYVANRRAWEAPQHLTVGDGLSNPIYPIPRQTSGDQMARFSIYSGLTLVGYSSLENGDPSMGVAFGLFEPTAGYLAIQNECRTNHFDQSGLALSVKTEAGVVIPSMGVAILDYAIELMPDCVEASILGIPAAFYEALFPDHVIKQAHQLAR